MKILKKKKLLKVLTGPNMMAVVRQLLEMLLHGEDEDEGDISPFGRHYRSRSLTRGSLNSYGGGFNYGDDEDNDDAPEKREKHKIKDDKKKKTKAAVKKN